MDSTYGNSIFPGNYVDIYMKAVRKDGKLMVGKLLENVKVLAVKDSQGRHVFENTVEARTPAYMLFALPEDMHLLFRKALYLQSIAGVEITLVPNTKELTNEDTVYISSNDIKTFIEEKTKDVDVSTILSETADQVGNSDPNATTNTENNG